MCQCGEQLAVSAGAAECGACGSRYAEAAGSLRPIAQPARAG
jgi:hypothetical protein